MLFELGVNILCFVDNNSDLLGITIDDIDLCNLHDIENIQRGLVFISRYVYSCEITESLYDSEINETIFGLGEIFGG